MIVRNCARCTSCMHDCLFIYLFIYRFSIHMQGERIVRDMRERIVRDMRDFACVIVRDLRACA